MARIKADRQAAREEAELRRAALPDLPTPERQLSDEEAAAARLRRAEEKRKELESFLEKTAEAPVVCVDCEWEPAMSQRQLGSFVRTLGRCYGSNKVAERPFRLLFSGVRSGSRTDQLLRKVCGFEHWASRVRISEEPYIRLFPRERLAYLSPEGEDVADTFDDPDRVFILGGLNDANHLTGKSRLKADLQGISSVRLPLQEHMQLKGGNRVLVANQVLDIMLDRRRGLPWSEVLAARTPSRKRRNKLS